MKGQFKINLKDRAADSMVDALGLTGEQESSMMRVLLETDEKWDVKMTDVMETMAEQAETLEQLMFGAVVLGRSQAPEPSSFTVQLKVNPKAKTIGSAFGITDERMEEIGQELFKTHSTSDTVAAGIVRVAQFSENFNELAVMMYMFGAATTKIQGVVETLEGSDTTLAAAMQIISDKK